MTPDERYDAADRVRVFVDAWQAAGRGDRMYAGFGTKVESTDPAETLWVADLLTLIGDTEVAS